MITVLIAVQSPVHSSMTFPFTQLESTALSALLIGTTHHHRQISSPLLHHNFTISLTQALLATAHQTVLISLCSTQSPPSKFVGSMALLSLLLPSGYLSQMWKGTVTYLNWCSLYSWCQSSFISIGHLCDVGLKANFNAAQCNILHGSKTIAQGMRQGTGLYWLINLIAVEYMNIAHATPDLETWHRHLGHVNYDSIIQMAEKKLATDLPTSLAYLPQICEHCVLAKQTQTPVQRLWEGGRVKRLLEKVFSDITGPETGKTSHGELYTLNLVEFILIV